MCSTAGNAIDAAVGDVHASMQAPSMALIEDLVIANHILFDQGVVDAFGHVSVRHDRQADRFLLARNMAPGQVTADDIIEFTLDGAPINANGRRVYIERFIHSEIYRRYPEVHAVVHSHSSAIVPLSTVKSVRLRALFHMAGFIGQDTPTFEIRDVAGPASDLLIRDSMLGAELARCFEHNEIVLMRGHGSTLVARTVQQAVFRAVYAELNARYQTAAMNLGEVTYLTAEESKACAQSHEAQVQRPWDLWKEQAAQKRLRS
ncbi:class II aldolase/adducin family protein [Herbaspirillum sp. GCM10030257]|uniref:class II aldolase/adducin family protein n=1 Tax=Herbaspirillum sp. GCM10030257 TaxID=3273393 RepID=UPI00361E00E8